MAECREEHFKETGNTELWQAVNVGSHVGICLEGWKFLPFVSQCILSFMLFVVKNKSFYFEFRESY